MSNVITRDKIKVSCPYPIYDIYKLEIEHKVNEHSVLKIIGILKGESKKEVEEVIYKIKKEDEIKVSVEGEEKEVIFTGMAVKVEIEIVNNNGYIKLECYSGSYNMDIKKERRTFQDVNMLYKEMLKLIVSKYEGGASIEIAGEGKKIGRAVIQYDESDWEFIKRIASEIGSVITVNEKSKDVNIWLGVAKANKKVEVKEEEKARGKVKRYIKREEEEEESKYYYQVELYEQLRIGDKVKIKGRELVVSNVKNIYRREEGILRNYYKLEEEVKRKINKNKKVRGVSIKGKVIEVKLNHIKVHLEIDEEQKEEEAFWYPYMSEGNNVWYNMPHIGEEVEVYIADREETGLAMSSVRGKEEDMGTPKSLSKATEKYMSTKWNKELALHEKDIEIDIPTVNIKMNEESIEVRSNDKINIETQKEINIGKTEFWYIEKGRKKLRIEESENIEIEAEEILTLNVKSTGSVIELDEDNKMHSLREVKSYGKNKSPSPVIKDITEDSKPPVGGDD